MLYTSSLPGGASGAEYSAGASVGALSIPMSTILGLAYKFESFVSGADVTFSVSLMGA